jgi:ElaB/YqjD/DUF883 family membrane-anchored ribosome-binding protein
MSSHNTPPSLSDDVRQLAGRAVDGADGAIRATQGVANAAFDRLSQGVESAREHTVPLIQKLSTQAESVARHSLESVRETSAHLRDRAVQARDSTAHQIQEDPLKAILIAAAAGAAMMAVVGWISRGRSGQ